MAMKIKTMAPQKKITLKGKSLAIFKEATKAFYEMGETPQDLSNDEVLLRLFESGIQDVRGFKADQEADGEAKGA